MYHSNYELQTYQRRLMFKSSIVNTALKAEIIFLMDDKDDIS